LLADGDAIALVEEAGQVGVGGVVRHPGHGHALALPKLAAGEGEVELPRRQPGVLVEHLVEVAEAEPEHRVRVAGFQLEVLAAGRGHSRPGANAGLRSVIMARNHWLSSPAPAPAAARPAQVRSWR